MAVKKVYILAGQSNLGRSRFSELSSPLQTQYGGVITGFSMYNGAADVNNLQPLQGGVNTMLENALNADEMGPEVSFAKSLQLDGQTGIFIKCGVGNTDLAEYWSPGGGGEILLKQRVKKAFELIIAAGDTPTIKAFIWMQGENDATVEAWALQYRANLFNFFSDFNFWLNTLSGQLGVSLNTNYTKIIGRINGASDPSEVYRDEVRQGQEEFTGDAFNNALLIDTDSYPLKDAVHYTAGGQITFGNDIFAVLPADTPPTEENVFGGQPNVAVAKTTIDFITAGINDTNTEIVYLVDNPLKSYVPSRTINGISGFESGKGYYIVAKTNINLSTILLPPIN